MGTPGVQHGGSNDFAEFTCCAVALSHPCDKEKPQGWGTETCGRTKRAETSFRKNETATDWGPWPLLSRNADLLLRFRGLVGYLDVVLDAEDAGNAVGANVRSVFVGLGVDHAVELNVAI